MTGYGLDQIVESKGDVLDYEALRELQKTAYEKLKPRSGPGGRRCRSRAGARCRPPAGPGPPQPR